MDLGHLSLSFSTFFCETASHCNWNSPNWLDWLASEALRSSCLTYPTLIAGVVGICPCLALMWVLGTEVNFLHLQSKLCAFAFSLPHTPNPELDSLPAILWCIISDCCLSSRTPPLLLIASPGRTPTLPDCLSCHRLPSILSWKSCFWLAGLPLCLLPLWLNLPSLPSITAGHRAL